MSKGEEEEISLPYLSTLRRRVHEVEEWYYAKTRAYPNYSRTLSILLATEELFPSMIHEYFTSEILAQVELKVSTDPQWNCRRNRKANERRALLVGNGKSKEKEGRPEFWYIVPKGGEQS